MNNPTIKADETYTIKGHKPGYDMKVRIVKLNKTNVIIRHLNPGTGYKDQLNIDAFEGRIETGEIVRER